MLSHNNWEEQIKKYEPKKQRFTIKKLSVGVASVLLGVTFAAGTASADSTTANADSASGSDSAEQTDHNLTLNSASTSTLKSATAENQSNNASAAVQNPAGDIKAQAANDYEAAVNAAVANASSDAASEAAQNSASVASSSAQASTASAVATQSFTVSSSAVNDDLNYASVFASLAAMPQANTAAQSSAANSTANDEYSGYKTVTNTFELQNAVNDFSINGVNVKGNINLFGDLNINRAFTIHGVDGAVLNLGQNKINNNGQLTLADVTVNGSIMGNGTVNIKGNVTSNVNSVNSSVPTQDQYNAQNYTGTRNNFKNSNITGSRVNIENGASLTINSSEINDGINLSDGGTVNVGDNATLNVNLTNASTTATRYHVAGVFAKNGGNFISGYKSNVNFNTGLGQAIAIGATRPTVTDSDRFGGYGARSRNDGPTLVQLGDSSTFNFTGRDGIILGNNANFISGENSNVHFENKGRGVALDLANNSNIEISKHSTTYFHSVGKTGTSGSYDGYNYIGVNEGGNITVDEYATFRVILEGRGDNPWDDVVSLDSQNANTTAAFTSKQGAIVDIRDDNTNFYAELISFPLGASNSRIDIQDPLMLNLQRYSNGGATTGWMATGGDMINTTSSQYTSNLIYMSGSKGVFSVSGGNYDPSNPNSSGFVVYQHIKSDGSKQIWLNVNDVNIPMNGFQTKDIWNNQANPDVSINGNGLTGGIKANQVHNFNGSPLTGKDAPYYGISTQRASQQIWIPHRTPLEITGNHTNTIKYVDEQGNEIFPENTSSLNLKRNIILDITQDQIKKIQDYALNHTADETLEYIKNAQAVSSDSGWKYTDANGNTVTDPYATVKSPELNGYTATIQSTNVQGLKAGEDGTSVTAKFAVDPSEDIVQNGELSDSYKNDGITGIPDNYVTVVVYKKAAEKGSVKVVYHDDTTNTDIPNTEYNTGSVDAGTKVDYNTSTTISNLENQGYVYVITDGTIPSTIEGNQNVVVTVHMKHGVQPVTPTTPPNEVPDKTPAEAQPDQLTKKINLTVNYVNSDGSTFTATVPANAKQTATFTGTAYVDKVTGQLVNATQQDGKWVIDENNTATPQITWTSDKTSFDKVVSPVEQNYHLISVSDHQDGNDVAAITGLTKDSGNIAVTVTYAPNGKIIPVDPSGNPIPDAPTPQYPTDPTDPSKVTPNEPVPNVPGYTPSVPTVTPTDPGKDTPVPYTKPAPEDQTVDSKQTVHYIDGDTNTAIREDSTNGTFTFVKSGQTGQWNADSHKFENVDAPVIDGYVAEKRTYEGQTSTPTDPNKEITIIYHKVGKIIPVDPSGNPIPDAPTPSYTNDPTDPTKVTPNEPTPNVPGWTTDVPNVTPEVPTKDTNVPYTKPTPTPEDQTVTVKYIDDTTGEGHTDLSSYDKSITAKPGEALNYTTQGSIAELENKGYKLVSDNFNVTTMPQNGGSYEVHFIHNTTTITPDKPGNPGEPINPNDPDGPKWPSGTDAKSLTKQGSQTVHYVYADGTKAADDNVQNTNFDHTLVFDNVTGKQIEDKGWTPASHKFNDVTSPTIDGYHADKTVVDGATVTVDNPTSETTVTYAKNGQETRDQQTVKASQTVKYVDEQGNELNPSKTQNFTYNYTGDTYDKETGDLISRGTWNQDSNDFTAENVPVIDGYVAVSGYTNNDGKYTAGGFTTTHGASDEQRNRVFTVVYKKVGKIIPVGPDGKTPIPDAPTPSYTNDPTDPTKVTPNEPVPTIPGYTPSTPTVTPGVPTEDTPVPYTPVTPAKDQQALVNYVDADENNKVITTSGDLSGKAGERIDYSTATTIQDLENKGYVLVNDGFPAGATYDNDDGTVQTYAVVLRHGTQPVTPTDPGKPGEPINPNDPDGPKYPAGSDQVTKNVTRTVQYVDENGNKVSESVEQTVNFTAEGILDKVTGQWTTPLTWSIDQTVSAVKSPVIDGYHLVNVDRDAAGNDVKGVTLTHDDNSYTVTVKYAKNGKIIPVDPSGKPISNVPTPQYPTDPSDPAKVTPNEPVPTIPGYTPETPTVTPDKPGEDTPVVYHPVDNTQNAQVRYIDLTNNEELANSGNLSGQPGDKINYSTADEIKSLEDKGYVLVNDGFPTDAAFDNDKDHDQIFTVTFRHGTQPVTPTNPGKPGEPINPNDPDGPKYPAGSDQVTKNVTRTVQYVDENGNKVSESVEQTVNFTAQGVLDKVTGQWTTPLTWSGSQSVAGVKTPVVEGYHVVNVDRDGNGNNVAGVTLTHENDSYTVTVKYAKNGKIIPVDPSGKPIPNVPTPQYPTDPTDPSKVTPDEPVPNVPGYTPSVPTITPTDPGKDTPVPYTPIVNDQTAVVNYVDQDNNNAQIATSGNLTGKPGSVINYSTADQIKQLEDQGYVLVSDGFPAGAVFDDDDNTTQTYTVVLKHGQQPVTPTNPGKPGEPINPNDPDGPKYPAGSDQVTKDVTRTIQYVDENGNKVSEPVEQTAHFTGEGVLDKVTGQWITPITWTGDGNLTGEKTPVVEGYHVVRVSRDSTDNINVDGTTVNHETNDYTVTVTYAKNGKIVPVDPSGKPIPNVPTPQYPTDPTDPSKVTPDEPVPTIPGYTPSVPTVTPTDPGKDTPVPYTPIVNDQTAVVNYVDQDNNNAQIATSGNLTGKPGSVINYSTADQIKQLEAQGYVLVSDGFPAGAVFDDDDNTTQTYTVVLKHGTTTFKPDKPGTPGEPINPNYPDGPKVTNEDVDYLKDVKFTIHYVGAGNDNPADNVQNAQWTRSITVDNVTGKIISSTEWVSNKESYDGVKTPVVNGYHADRAQVDGPSVTMEDQEATVTYVPNGKIIPVDPNGNPIPDVPTPQYPTDPTDPTKVTPDEPVPTIPGYKPEVPTVTPTDPGVD
ncbi:mucin-binding protein, partial [Limosilactobacillus reuteri]